MFPNKRDVRIDLYKKPNTNEVKTLCHKKYFRTNTEVKEEKTGMTALGGLATYLDLAAASGLMKSIERNLKVRAGDQGWTDRQMVMSRMMLNISGGDYVEDIEKLEGDEGFCRIVRKAETYGLSRKAKVLMKKSVKKGKHTFRRRMSI